MNHCLLKTNQLQMRAACRNAIHRMRERESGRYREKTHGDSKNKQKKNREAERIEKNTMTVHTNSNG